MAASWQTAMARCGGSYPKRRIPWWYRPISWWLCAARCHRWDYPGGHCEDCGVCDEFFGEHDREHEDDGEDYP